MFSVHLFPEEYCNVNVLLKSVFLALCLWGFLGEPLEVCLCSFILLLVTYLVKQMQIFTQSQVNALL